MEIVLISAFSREDGVNRGVWDTWQGSLCNVHGESCGVLVRRGLYLVVILESWPVISYILMSVDVALVQNDSEQW